MKNTFFVKTYEIVKKIPFGKVATYGQIAEEVNSLSTSSRKITPRVVGWALHANDNPDIPCHRVVNKDGRLAINYSMGGWREQKRRLVAEGVKFKDETHVDLAKCDWKHS